MRNLSRAVGFFTLVCVAATAQAGGPLDLIPADALVCWKGAPYPELADGQDASAQPSALATLIDAGTRIAGAPLRPRQKLALRLVEAFGAAARKPFALAILDAQARPTDDGEGKRVEKLQIALVIRTEGKNEPFLKIVQKAVNELTDQGQATLEQRTAEKWKYNDLSDRRLSESIAWGAIGDYFVVTYGPGVWPRVAAAAAGNAPSMARDEWVTSVRNGAAGVPVDRGVREGIPAEEGARNDSRTSDAREDSRTSGHADPQSGVGMAPSKPPPKDEPLIEVILAAKELRERLDPFVDGRASRFFRALDASDVDRAHWALGFQGRALYCTGHYRERGRTVQRTYADANVSDERIMAVIPPDARYAVYRLALPWYMSRAFSRYYATRDDKDRAAAERFWERIQAELKFDGQKDLLDRFGETIILHNDPPHPLRLPLAFTTLIEIRGDAKAFRETVERILVAWQKHLTDNEEGEETGWTRLERDDDGVWYLQYGPIAGLAWTISDGYLMTSWSPGALRESIAKLRERVHPAPATRGP